MRISSEMSNRACDCAVIERLWWQLPTRSKKFISNHKNEQVMKFNPTQSIECNPVKGIGLNSYYLNMRHELHSLGQLSLQERRDKMKRRLIEDFRIEEKELNDVDLGSRMTSSFVSSTQDQQADLRQFRVSSQFQQMMWFSVQSAHSSFGMQHIDSVLMSE
ncbi:hypothetical protein HUJ05_012276 [Dendroctonus ponderosae]|nr:hypothetical protein HUJ05_009618 [Dendroctonus ponderosae]KAH1002073.1 hypothetical protein HUJ05_012276 [Dendroctonus ponderosae]